MDERGAALWSDLHKRGVLTPAARVLAEEACRIVDRLEKLDHLLSGDAESWIDIVETRGNPELAELVINAPLAEARQQALALKQIFTELRMMGALAAADSGAQPTAGGGEDDELAARRKARIADAAGR
ncbi:hypothetical protein [Catelliglobosispora koreensis]|uniref:hypothetical protein n=1 Tax=Catelliglobosispora koreensis TaxID=129052 RepID=UPI0003A8D79D|nr:hypothetical protein [Catelliglobosispora koreensis]